MHIVIRKFAFEFHLYVFKITQSKSITHVYMYLLLNVYTWELSAIGLPANVTNENQYIYITSTNAIFAIEKLMMGNSEINLF